MATPKYEKRGNYYQFRYQYMENGKRVSVSKSGFKRKKDAETYGKEFLRKLDAGLKMSESDILFADYFRKWQKLYRTGAVTPRTELTINRLGNVIEKEFNLKLKEITRDKYQEFLNKQAETLSKATVNLYHSYFKLVLEEAFHQKIIEIDPTRNIIVKGNNSNTFTEDTKFMSKKEFRDLEDALLCGITPKNSARYLLLLIMHTGMRVGEAMALTWDCVDFLKNKITINKSYDYLATKTIKETKTAAGNRTIFIPEKMMDLLEQRLEFKTAEDSLVFDLCSHNNITSILHRAVKRAGIDRRIRIHSLRHTHASILLAEGVQPLIVSKRLGHSNLAITMKTYAHVIAETQKTEDEKINNIFS